MRVAAGAVARKVLDHLLDRPSRSAAPWSRWAPQDRPRQLGLGRGPRNPFLPRTRRPRNWESYLDGIRKSGLIGVGAVIEVTREAACRPVSAIRSTQAGSDLAKAMMSINAVKGVEIGAGFAAAALSGEENADEMRMQ